MTTHPPGQPSGPTGPGRHRLAQARWDAAITLIRAADDLRLLAQLGRATDTDKRRHDTALGEWNLLAGGAS